MSGDTLPPTGFGDSETMNYVVRMVIPMRREFGRSLDVPHFMHDFAYAKEVIEQAKISQNEKLREYAYLIDSRLFGPRYSGATEAATPSAPKPSKNPARLADEVISTPDVAPAPANQLTEHEMRLRMMAKYKGGLR